MLLQKTHCPLILHHEQGSRNTLNKDSRGCFFSTEQLLPDLDIGPTCIRTAHQQLQPSPRKLGSSRPSRR